MYTPDDASEVLVLRALLSCGGMRRCASQPRSWRRDAARPRKRSDHWLWPGSADGHMPESLWHGACWGGVAERLFWSWLTASGTFATTNRGSRAELCKAVVLACWCTARCGKPFACTRATDEHAAAAAASRGRGRRLSPGVDRAAGEASPGGVCASPVLLRRAGAFSRRRGSPKAPALPLGGGGGGAMIGLKKMPDTESGVQNELLVQTGFQAGFGRISPRATTLQLYKIFIFGS